MGFGEVRIVRELKRRNLQILVALAIILAACGTGTDANSDRFDTSAVSAGEPIMTLSNGGGDCGSECNSTVALFADGRIEHTKFDALYWQVQHDDVAQMIAEIEAASPADIVTAQDDCGREVDGFAPVWTFAGVVVDACFYDLDPAHPLMVATREVTQSPPGIEVAQWVQISESTATETVERLSQLEASPWPERFSPIECVEQYAVTQNSQGEDVFLAVSQNGDVCEVWIDDVGRVSSGACRISRTYPVPIEVRVGPGFFRCSGV